MKRKSLYEILSEAQEIETVEDRAKFLQQNNSNALQTLLKITYDTTIKWDLPKGIPPYKPSVLVESQGLIYSNTILRKFKIFFKNQGYDHLDKIKKEKMFIEFLETLDAKDAELICYVKENRQLPFRKLQKTVIQKTFPKLLGEHSPVSDSKENEE